MEEQSKPAGQQITACMELVVLSGRHTVSCGQVKSFGNDGPHAADDEAVSLGEMFPYSCGLNSAGIQTTRAVVASTRWQITVVAESLIAVYCANIPLRVTNFATCAFEKGRLCEGNGKYRRQRKNAR